MDPIVVLAGLSKTYDSGFQALKSVDLEIRRGEIFALLGPALSAAWFARPAAPSRRTVMTSPATIALPVRRSA